MKPCSKKSSGRAFAAGSMTSRRRLPPLARSKSARMAAEYGGETKREDRADADRGTEGLQHRHPGKRQHAEADYRRDGGEDERDQGAAALVFRARQAVEEERIVGADRDHEEKADEVKDRQ